MVLPNSVGREALGHRPAQREERELIGGGWVPRMGNQLLLTYQDIQAEVTNLGGASSDNVFTCPDGTPAVLHGHKYWCHP